MHAQGISGPHKLLYANLSSDLGNQSQIRAIVFRSPTGERGKYPCHKPKNNCKSKGQRFPCYTEARDAEYDLCLGYKTCDHKIFHRGPDWEGRRGWLRKTLEYLWPSSVHWRVRKQWMNDPWPNDILNEAWWCPQVSGEPEIAFMA